MWRVDIHHFQQRMRVLYGQRDAERGLARTYAWFVEEVGELSRALFRADHDARLVEFGDALAWLASLAEQAGVDLDEAASRYRDGCPRCGAAPCACPREHP